MSDATKIEIEVKASSRSGKDVIPGPGGSTGAAASDNATDKEKEVTCSPFNWYDVKCSLVKLVFPGSPFSTGQGLQVVEVNGERYSYYPSFINPTERIQLAMKTEWTERDLFISTSPKSGTHFMMLLALLIKYKGDLPEKTCIHSLCCSVEFLNGPAGDMSRDHTDPSSFEGPSPRVLISHMPRGHIVPSPRAKFIYVMRDPVPTLASLRRMEYLMFGPHLISPLDSFLHYHLSVRETGWLDHVLSWWAAKDEPNVLIVTYEELIRSPIDGVKKIAKHMNVELTDPQLQTCVLKMDKKWALANVDPYLFQAKTPFSPPDRDGMSSSGFIVNSAHVKEGKFSAYQENDVREAYTKKIRAIISESAIPVKAELARSFFEAHRDYFSK